MFIKKMQKIECKNELNNSFFLIEHKYFSSYSKCPKNFDEYKESFSHYPLFAYCYIDSDSIGAIRMLMKITELHYHAILLIVEKKFQKNGIAKIITIEHNKMAKQLGAKYITEFSAIPYVSMSINSNEITSYLRYSDLNCGLYRELFGNLLICEDNFYQDNDLLIFKNYYQMIDGPPKDACFLVYQI